MSNSKFITQINYKNFVISSYKLLESTNLTALELAKAGLIANHHVILAHKQSAGRGRYGRNWDSSGENNLYFSLILNNIDSDNSKKNKSLLSHLSFISAVSMGLAIENFNQTSEILLNYKWPNDILINGKKAAGILLESHNLPNYGNFLIIGIGVNVDYHPSSTNYPATNLLQEGFVNVKSQKLLECFLDNFDNLYQKWQNYGFAPIRNLWLEKAFNLNKEINVNLPDKSIKAVFKDLDQDGNLIVELDNKIIKIASGEIFSG